MNNTYFTQRDIVDGRKMQRIPRYPADMKALF